MFVISCAFDENNPIIYECLTSIKNFMPDEKIAVAFSYPPKNFNKDYYNLIDDILTYENKNYSDGALWLAYEKHPSENFFFWIHDSLLIKNNLDNFKNEQVTCIRWFPEGKDNPDMYYFISDNVLNICNYTVPFNFIGILGPMLFVNKSILEKAKLFGIDKFKPKNKYEANVMERIWGIFLQSINLDMTKNCIQGRHFNLDENYDNTLILKKYLHRL